jgi:hypothetical protein
MQSEPVALRIDNDGAIAVRANLLPFFQNFAAIRTRGLNRGIEATVNRKINERPGLGWPIGDTCAVGRDAKTAGRILFCVRQQPILKSAFRPSAYFPAKHGGIKLDCPLEINDRNICPT